MSLLSKTTRGVLAAVTLSLIVVGACSDDDVSTPPVTTGRPVPVTTTTSFTTTTTEAPSSPADDLEDFCTDAARAAEDVPQSYVGSEEHVAQLRQLAALAPASIREELELMAQHFQDNVDPANPPSQFYERFPESVKAAINEVDLFVDQHCPI